MSLFSRVCHQYILKNKIIKKKYFPGLDFKFRLSFLMWYPFEVNTHIRYWLVLTQQWHAGFIAAFCFLATDIFLFSILTMLIMIFHYIAKEIEKMPLTGGDKDVLQLKPLVLMHQKALDLADLNSSVFSITVLVNFISSTAMICFTAFQLTAAGMDIVELGRYIIFLSHQLLQVGTICYLGEKLIEAVSSFLFLLYNFYEFKFFRVRKLGTRHTVKIGCPAHLITRRIWHSL